MPSRKFSKKFSVLAVVFVLLLGIFIGGYLVLKSHRGSASPLDGILKGKTFSINECQPDASDPNKDSDSDGLKDWQEIQLYHSDACQQDTDGDGYFDGEEVASGYNPAKKAPNDALSNAKNPRPLPDNLTEALRQQLAEQITQNRIAAFDADGQLLSADQLENYPGIEEAIAGIITSPSELFAPDFIDEKQIKTTDDNSVAAIQKYARQAADAFPNISPTKTKGEGDMFYDAIAKNDFIELDQELKIYQSAYENLKTLVVPADLLPIHKEQLEIISEMIKIYQGLKELANDPLRVNLALLQYNNVINQLTNWNQKLVLFLKNHPQ